jgi:hypothetical protein
MADKRVFGELSDKEVKDRAATCGVDLGDAQRFQVGHQSLPSKDVACLKTGMADDPTANTGTLSRLAGAAIEAFSSVNAGIKEGFVAIVSPAVDAVKEVAGPMVTLGARRAEGPANYDTPKAPGR